MADTQTRVSGTVVGYFERYSDAQEAVSGLQESGFKANQIGLASRTGSPSSSGADYTSGATTTDTTTDTGSTTAGHTASGTAHAAGMWDKIKNFFEGGAAEPYAEENRKGDMATREITSTGSDYDYDNYGTDDFRQSLSGLSVPEEHSRYFSHKFENSSSGAVVTVTAPGRKAEAERILEEYGADLGSNAANYDYSASTGATTAAAANTATGTTAENTGQQRIQLLGEVLRVHKDRVNRGDVRVRKEVITEQQSVQVPVTREELVVERVPVSGEQAAQGRIGENSEIRIPLSEERASLDKQTVVREEVSLGKRAVENVRNVQGDVRREELVVDDQSKATASGRTDDLRDDDLRSEDLRDSGLSNDPRRK